jgi:DNA-binding MarR family transcriptional regulator
MKRRTRQLRDRDFERLLRFRDGLRIFQHWSEEQARAAGLTGTQHQLLLAVRGHGSPPSVRDVADHLLLRHHSVVEQIDRAERAGLLARTADPGDHRVVRIALTELGESRLTALSHAHLEELSRLQETFAALWEDLPPK